MVKQWDLFQARKRKLGLLEDEEIANLASAASAQGSEFAAKDAAKDKAPLTVAKSNGKFLISHLWFSCPTACSYIID
jgi:hypothetical protein